MTAASSATLSEAMDEVVGEKTEMNLWGADGIFFYYCSFKFVNVCVLDHIGSI